MSLEPEYQAALKRWKSGDRDRELALQSLFLAWMHWADPSFVTGFNDADVPEAQALWHEIYAHFGGHQSKDAEFLFVAAHMAMLFPWALGPEPTWKKAAAELAARATSLDPSARAPERFAGRGAYGEYFAHIFKTRAGAA